jgi:uncharacterized protein DUF4339
MWYYNLNNQQTGPVDEEAIKPLISNNTITAGTLVWKAGMEKWLPLQQTPLAAFLPADAPPPIAGPAPAAAPPPMLAPRPPGAPQRPPQEEAKSIEALFMWYWILLAAGALLSIVIIGIPAVIASVVLWAILLYKLWSVIQDGEARTTPGKGVGFMFIPFFNYYWQFVAFWGLAQDMNKYTRARSIQAPVINEQLAMIVCILFCCGIIPYLGVLAVVAAVIMQILVLKDMRDAAIAILRTRQ